MVLRSPAPITELGCVVAQLMLVEKFLLKRKTLACIVGERKEGEMRLEMSRLKLEIWWGFQEAKESQRAQACEKGLGSPSWS